MSGDARPRRDVFLYHIALTAQDAVGEVGAMVVAATTDVNARRLASESFKVAHRRRAWVENVTVQRLGRAQRDVDPGIIAKERIE